MSVPSLVAAVAAVAVACAPTPAQAQTRPLVVGSSATYPPFAYETPTKQIVGFDVDVIQAVAQKAGLTLRIVNTPFTGVFASLVNGDLDLVISGVTITDRRRQSYDFTAPYFEARQLIAVPASSPVRRPAGPDRQEGRAWSPAAPPTRWRRAAFGKTSPNIRRFDTTPLIIAELVAGGVDAAIGDNGVIAYRVAEHKTLKTVSDPGFPKEYFGIVVKQGNTALRDRLNTALAAIIADGTYARIYRTWFKTEPPVLPKQ